MFCWEIFMIKTSLKCKHVLFFLTDVVLVIFKQHDTVIVKYDLWHQFHHLTFELWNWTSWIGLSSRSTWWTWVPCQGWDPNRCRQQLQHLEIFVDCYRQWQQHEPFFFSQVGCRLPRTFGLVPAMIQTFSGQQRCQLLVQYIKKTFEESCPKNHPVFHVCLH